jgi:hypothetical protein
MKKSSQVKKLSLNRETLTSLEMNVVTGGYTASVCHLPGQGPTCDAFSVFC